MKFELPDYVQKEIKKYSELELGGKKVPCPYYINISKERGGLRVLVGKGSAEEISHEVQVWARLKGFDLNNATPEEIREFMVERKIGIDCSGFAVHIYNRWLKRSLGKRLVSCLKHPRNSLWARFRRALRSAENIAANTLTSEENNIKITNLNNIRPGDMIRLKGRVKNAHHLVIVSEVNGDVVGEEFKIKNFKYVQSARYYDDQHGLREGKVIITNPNGEIKDQKWTDVYKGKNWTYEELLKNYEDNGVRRLKCLEKEIENLYRVVDIEY